MAAQQVVTELVIDASDALANGDAVKLLKIEG